MKQHRNPILNGVTSRVRQLLERFEESECIAHAATKGSLREAYLRQFLSDLIPIPFGLRSGFVTDCRGEDISPQIDLIVFDKASIPAFALSEFVTLVPLESARLAIEVKSLLKSNDLDQVKRQQECVRRLRYSWTTIDRRYLHTVDCTGLLQHIVALDTSCSRETLLSWFAEEEALDAICIIGEYALLRDPNSSEVVSVPKDADHSEVMQLISKMHSTIQRNQRDLRAIQVETPDGEVTVEPDIGAYLTFDVPYPDPPSDSSGT